MRKKSPASVQKWVDSIQIPPSTSGTASATEPGPSSSQLAEDLQLCAGQADPEDMVGTNLEIDSSDIVEELQGVATTSNDERTASEALVMPLDGKSRSIKNLLSLKLEKFNRTNINSDQESSPISEQKLGATEEEPQKKSTSLASIGKIKINEFYDKLSMNKAKYNLIKAKKNDIRNMLGASKENLTHILQRHRQHEGSQSDVNVGDVEEEVEHLQLDEGLDDCKLHQSEVRSL